MADLCEGADLCAELAGSAHTEFSRTYDGDPPSRLLGATDSLALLADLSPLAFGHMLLLPKRHHLSFVTVSQEHGAELALALDLLVPAYRSAYGGRLTVLEHGSAPDMVGTACIHHAHWHLLPLDPADVDAVLERDGLPAQEVDGLAGLASGPVDEPYFLRWSPGHGMRLHGVGARVRRQHLRAVAGEVLGTPDPEWDWTAVVRRDVLRRTVAAWPRPRLSP